MKDRFVFGYGSLVNRRTHSYEAAHPARVTGWRRAWRKTPLRDRCFLTVLPEAGAETLGLIAQVPAPDWSALDLREAGYHRHDVSQHVDHALAPRPEIALYAIPEAQHHAPGPDDPIALSYIDTVVAGFLTEHGPEGVAHFFASTSGWALTVEDDRAVPLYGRAQTVPDAVRRLTDSGLATTPAKVLRR